MTGSVGSQLGSGLKKQTNTKTETKTNQNKKKQTNHVPLKIQLEKNSFEMLKLPLGGDEDINSPFYFRIEATFNLPDAPIPALIVCRMTHKLWVVCTLLTGVANKF